MIVDDWGTSVPEVCDVLVVVLGAALDDVVDRAVVVVAADVVDVVEDGLGLLEQAAKARAHTGMSGRQIDRLRRAVGMAQFTTGRPSIGSTPAALRGRNVARPSIQARAGAVPMTEARSMERR